MHLSFSSKKLLCAAWLLLLALESPAVTLSIYDNAHVTQDLSRTTIPPGTTTSSVTGTTTASFYQADAYSSTYDTNRVSIQESTASGYVGSYTSSTSSSSLANAISGIGSVTPNGAGNLPSPAPTRIPVPPR